MCSFRIFDPNVLDRFEMFGSGKMWSEFNSKYIVETDPIGYPKLIFAVKKVSDRIIGYIS